MTGVEQVVYTGVRNVRTLTRVSLHPISNGCTEVALMAEYDDAKQAGSVRVPVAR